MLERVPLGADSEPRTNLNEISKDAVAGRARRRMLTDEMMLNLLVQRVRCLLFASAFRSFGKSSRIIN